MVTCSNCGRYVSKPGLCDECKQQEDMKHGHTAGPYHKKKTYFREYDICNKEGKIIATVSYYCEYEDDLDAKQIWFEREEAEANADLFIAAPDLLEAAKAALGTLENALDDIADHSKASPSLAKQRAEAKRKLRVAIAKAYGSNDEGEWKCPLCGADLSDVESEPSGREVE